MKLLTLLILLALPIAAQERQLSPRRNVHPAPYLATFSGTDDAAGVAQTPWLEAMALSDRTIPVGSTVGIYGSHLASNNVTSIYLSTGGELVAVDATVQDMRILNLEMITFHLPEHLRGDVWISVVGRRVGNSVKITVE